MSTIKIKRIYEPFEKSDGYRVLIDRLWPRGMSKEKARADLWLKEVAPGTALRKWFNHEPEKWNSFLIKYRAELERSTAFKELISITEKHKMVTLLYSAKDEHYNQAVALKGFINS